MTKKELQASKEESKTYYEQAKEWIAAYKTHTVYLIAIITVTFTIAVLPLFRLIAQQDGGNKSKAADAAYYVLSDIFGIGIIVYPWWLATSKSPLYYSRLQYYGRIMGAVVLILAGIQGIFTPDKPFDKNDPSKTSLAYKIVYSLDVVAILGGFLVALPILIRRDRLFKSNSRGLFRFAWLFTVIMIVGLLLRRWMGFSRIVSFSCVFLVVQFFILDTVEEIERQQEGKVSLFDEAYIIIAGFVPYWIAYAVGNTLLEIVSQAGAIGTVFVYVSWRVIIYAFEYMSSEVGRKASRYSDGSVFSFAAIYTGATFANFIFLSVEFNSGTFWALAFITAANIIIVQGGLMIDIDYFFMDYIAVTHNWPFVYTLKMLYFEKIRVIPHAMSEKIVKCGENLTPEIKLALIRSRAKVLQLNWVHNDIKMASEFQALACAATAVAFEMVYSYYGVGSDSITAGLQDRPGALYIYCVNIIFSFVAQFIARRRLRHKVLRLKQEISATVKALEAGAAVVPPPVHRTTSKRGSPMSILGINPLASSNRNSTSSPTAGNNPGNRSSARMKRGPVSMRRNSTTMFSALTGAFHPSRRDFNTADLETGGLEDEPPTEDEQEAHENDMLISEQDVDTDALNAILGLCNLYATEEMMEMESKEAGNNNSPTKAPPSPLKTANSLPFSTRRGGRGVTSDGEDDGPKGAETRRFGKIRFVRGEDPDAEDPNIDEGEDDGWEEVQLNSNRLSATFRSSITGGLGFKQRMSTMFGGLLGTETGGAERRGSSRPVAASASTNAVRMQGYLNKRKPGTTTVYQRRFFLLTDKQLMWFASEEDVEQHINRRKGAISIASITNLDRYDPSSLCMLSIAVNSGRVYVLMAIDRSCADDWYDMIQECRKGLHKAKKNNGDASEVDEFDGEVTDRASTSQPNTTFFPSWFGGGGNGGGAGGGDSEKVESRPSFFGGASANYRPSLAFNLGSMGLTLGHENIHEHVEEEAGGVTQMLRRGTTNARRGLGSIFHAASTALPLVATAASANAASESAEVWRAGWDMSDLPRKMGYLQKKGEINASWQQRWFVIGHTGNLSWYDKAGSERHQKPKGCVSMGEVVCVKGVDPDNPLLIEIRHIHGRVYQLEAASELDAEDWRSVLEKWVVSARAAIDKYNNEHNGVFVQGSSSNTTYDQDQEEEEEALASGVESKEPDSAVAGAAPVPTVAQRKTGFMQKRGGGARSTAFKKRWFVLDHPGVLSWYEKVNGEKFGKPKGSIDLCEIMCVKTASYDAPCLVEIRHIEGRVYEIEANSVQEAEDWRVALNLWLKVAYDLKKAAAKPMVSAAVTELNQEDFTPISESEEATTMPDTPGTDNNTDAVKKKKFSMYSKLGFGKSTRKPKYAELSAQSPAVDKSIDGSAKRSPGSPVAELDDLYPPELSATEMIESLTRERATKAPAISPPRTVPVVRTPRFNNPLFPATGKARSRKNPELGELAEDEQKEPGPPAQVTRTLPSIPSPLNVEESLAQEHAVAPNLQDLSTPVKTNPLVRTATAPTSKVSFQVPSVTYNMSQDLGVGDKERKQPTFVTAAAPATPPSDVEKESTREDGSDDEEVTQYQSSVPFGRSAAPFSSSAQSPTSEDQSSRDSTPSLSSASPAPRSGRRGRGARRGSTAFSEICAQVAAHAPDTLPVAAEEETVVADYNRHRASIDKVLSERSRGIISQPVTEQRAKRQPVKRNNLLGGPSHVETPAVKKVNRRESELADSKFMRRMAKRHSSELVDNLQKKSYKDMNSEFWVTHKWYLACVVCFVTLNVLYSTSYIVSQY